MMTAPKGVKTKEPKQGRKPHGTSGKKARGFYGHVVDEAERILLNEAREVQGLDEEIALLRMKLAQAIQDHPEDVTLMLRGMELLVKAVSARYRLSEESKDDLASSLEQVIRQLGGAFFPEAFREE